FNCSIRARRRSVNCTGESVRPRIRSDVSRIPMGTTSIAAHVRCSNTPQRREKERRPDGEKAAGQLWRMKNERSKRRSRATIETRAYNSGLTNRTREAPYVSDDRDACHHPRVLRRWKVA